MERADAPSLIGIDGGGTACRVALVHGGRRVEARSGAANVTTDPEGAVASILAGLSEVAEGAGLSLAELRDCPAYLGLAGVIGEAEAARVGAALPLSRAVVEDDRRAAVVGALGPSDGAVIGIGTGSFVARRSGGGIRLVGGHGLVLGDEGSAAWLGRELLAHVLHVADGMEAPTPLTRRMFERFGGRCAEIVAFARGATPAEFGALAPDISAAAGEGDTAGQMLMRRGAACLERALAALGWSTAEPLCLLGGAARGYLPWLSPDAAGAVRAPEGSALDGALALAGELAR